MRFNEFLPEAANPEQQAAIAIAKKNEQDVAEGSTGWHPSSTVKNPNFNDELSGRRVSPPGSRLKSGKLSADERGSQERTKALMKFTQKKGGLTGPKGHLPEEQDVAEGSDISGLLATANLNKSFIITADTAEGQTKKFRVKAISERVAREKFKIHHSMAKIVSVKEEGVAEGENWSKYNHKRVGGMSKKSVASYRRSHPGSKIQTAVTTKPSKLKKGSKAAKRRASFCARMRGMKKHRTSAKTAHDPNSNINKSLRRWHCESIEEMRELVMLAEQFIRNHKK